jgi:hypothetical protein
VLLAMVLAACGRLGFDDLARPGDAGPTSDAIDAVPDAAAMLRYAYIKPDNTETFDRFGFAIALSADGTTLAVGAPAEDGPGNAIAQSGGAYVFVRSGDTWIQQGYLRATDAALDDQFGASIAISGDGNTIAVGAPNEDSESRSIDTNPTGISASDAGAVYVFARNGTAWSQQAYIKSFNSDAGDNFGWSVSLSASGDRLAVGAPFEDSTDLGIDQTGANGSPEAGAAYTFTRTGTTWARSTYFKASNTGGGDNFGYAVALSGDGATLVVGSPQEDSGTTTINGTEANEDVTEGGAAYVFVFAGSWAQQAYVKPSTIDFGDFFGRVLALSADGNTLASSSMGDDSVIPNSGAVFTFARSGITWTETAKLKAPNAGDNDQFGWALAIADNLLLVGAGWEDSDAAGGGGDPNNDNSPNSGAVYQFKRSAATWAFDGYIKGIEPDEGDQFGSALGISQDGLVRAAASDREDSAANMINGDATDDTAMDSGSVGVSYR